MRGMKRRMRGMKRRWIACLAVIGVLAACTGRTAAPAAAQSPEPHFSVQTPAFSAGEFWPTRGWRFSTPEAQGMDGAKLDAALEAAEQRNLSLHGLLVIRHGCIVKEKYFSPYDAGTRHDLFSCTKSFVSALMGIAIEKGYVADTARLVLGFFPRSFARTDSRKRALTVENLLTMSSGLGWAEGDETYERMYTLPGGDWISFVLDSPMVAEPGRRFTYSSGNSHILAAIIQRSSGKDLYDFARASLFGPLGISDLRWERDPEGLPIGGWGLRLSPRDMAKLGYLYLHEGLWEGKQVVPAAWVRESTRPHIKADGGWGYGYQWWVDPAVPFFAARGRYGQAIFVVPSLDLVVVFTAHIQPIDPEQELLESYIIPACTTTSWARDRE
jgi:CubicO group peptidase (beta-lactamase class C family)